LTFKLDLDGIKLNQHAKCLELNGSKVIALTRDGTGQDFRDPTRPVTLPLKPAGWPGDWPAKITTFR